MLPAVEQEGATVSLSLIIATVVLADIAVNAGLVLARLRSRAGERRAAALRAYPSPVTR